MTEDEVDQIIEDNFQKFKTFAEEFHKDKVRATGLNQSQIESTIEFIFVALATLQYKVDVYKEQITGLTQAARLTAETLNKHMKSPMSTQN